MIEIATPEDFFLCRSGKVKKLTFPRLSYVSEKSLSKKSTKGNAYRNTKSGYRDDLDMNVRSNWEANFARILNGYKIKFEFEPKIFSFPIKRGSKGYTPDFYLTKTKEWIEIKGYLDDKSKTKLRRFKRYYPEEFSKMTFIISKYSSEASLFAEEMEFANVIFYEDISKEYSELVPNWEGK